MLTTDGRRLVTNVRWSIDLVVSCGALHADGHAARIIPAVAVGRYVHATTHLLTITSELSIRGHIKHVYENRAYLSAYCRWDLSIRNPCYRSEN